MNPDNKVPQVISSGGFQHDLVRCLIILWGQRNNYKVYSEPKGYGDYQPDLVLKQKKRYRSKVPLAFVEVQKIISTEWLRTKYVQYLPKHLIVINLKHFPTDSVTPEELYDRLSEQLSMETDVYLPKKEKRRRTPKTKPERRYYDYRGHHIKEGNERRIDYIEDNKERK